MTLEPGIRVVRGPGCFRIEQDEEKSDLGTIVSIDTTKYQDQTSVEVLWDRGLREDYRKGLFNSHDLRLYDNGTVGVSHIDVRCDVCRKCPIFGIRWKCMNIDNYNICSACYHGGKDACLSHHFYRILVPGAQWVPIEKRSLSRAIEVKGLFPGAKVRVGSDLKVDKEDDRNRYQGTLERLEPFVEGFPNTGALVNWPPVGRSRYRVGFKGMMDLKTKDPGLGGMCYRSHLPVLGYPFKLVCVEGLLVGDHVIIDMEENLLRELQEGHGDWLPGMADEIGQEGVIRDITSNQDIMVEYPESSRKWIFLPAALTKVPRGLSSVVEVDESGDVIAVDKTVQQAVIPKSNPSLNRPDGSSGTSKSSDQRGNFLSEAEAIDAAQGNEQKVQEILKGHPEWVNSPSYMYDLQYAVRLGLMDAAKSLIAAGADLDMTDEDGDTALMLAICGNHPDIVAYLLTKGANINIVNNEGRSALHQAVTRCYIECMKVLLAHHCDVNIQDNFGDTALHDAISGQSNPVLSLLLENGGINFKLSNKRQFNALQWAAMKGNKDAIHRILNIDPELAGISNTDGQTALHIAARNNFEDIARILIVKGECIVDDYTVDHQTPLLLAVRAGHTKTLEVLLKLWANVNLPDADGDTSLHVALLRQVIYPDVTETILLKKIRSRILDQSVSTSGLALACLLVEYKADLCHVNNKGQTPLDIVPDTKIHAVLRHFNPEGRSPGRLGDTGSLEAATSSPKDGFDKLPRQNKTEHRRAQQKKMFVYKGLRGPKGSNHEFVDCCRQEGKRYRKFRDDGTRAGYYRISLYGSLKGGCPDPESSVNQFEDWGPEARGYGENRDEDNVAGDCKEPQSKVDDDGGAGARPEHIQLQQDKEKQCRLARCRLIGCGGIADAQFKPCGHTIVCHRCSECFKLCHECKTPIETILQPSRQFPAFSNNDPDMGQQTPGAGGIYVKRLAQLRQVMESEKVTTEAEKNNCDNLPEKAQSDRTDSEQPLNYTLGHPVELECVEGLVVGDHVIIDMEENLLRELQEGHGDWVPGMADEIGQEGVIRDITSNQDIMVEYPESSRKWIFHPAILTKVRRRLSSVVEVDESGDYKIAVDKTVQQADIPKSSNSHKRPDGSSGTSKSSDQRGNVRLHEVSMRVGLKKSKDLSEAVAVAIAAAQGNEQNVRGILKDHPEWVNSPSDEKSPLQLAVHGGFMDVTKFLIAAGADLDMTDEDGDTALMFAIYGNHPDIVKYLLFKGANINIVNKERRSALHQAVTRCYIECMKVLLAYHCDVNIQDNFGDTALHDAISGQSNPVLSLLLENGGLNFKLSNKRQFNALQWAAMKGNQTAIQRILNIDPELAGISSMDGQTALHIAARNNFEDIVRILIVKGECSVDDYTVDHQTPLLLAVRAGHIETLEVLLKLWANVNLPDADGDISLHVALLRQVIFPDVTETNLLTKIRSRIPDQSVATSGLALACLLVEYKADLCHVNNKGQTPLDIVPDTKIHAVLRHFVPAVGSPGQVDDTESLEAAPSIAEDDFDKSPRRNETDQERAQREKIEYYEGQVIGARPEPEGRDNRFADSGPGARGYGENRDESTVAGDRKEPQSKVDDGGGAGARQGRDLDHIAKQQMEEMQFLEGHQAASGDKPIADPAGDSAADHPGDNRGQIPEHIAKQESQLLVRPPLPQLDLSPQRQLYPHHRPAPDTTPSPISIQSTPTPTSLLPNLARCRLIACGGIADAQFKPCGHTIVCHRCSQCFKLCHECKKPIESVSQPSRRFPAFSNYNPDMGQQTPRARAVAAQGAMGDDPSGARRKIFEPEPDSDSELTKSILIQKNQKLEEDLLCPVCIDQKREFVFLCGHSLCEACTGSLDDCPMCRQPILKKIKIVTTEAEKNNCDNLLEKAQGDRTDSEQPLNYTLAGGLTELAFPQKIEAQGPSGGQIMTQEPTATIDQPLLDDKSSKNQGNVASGGMDQHSEEASHHITTDLDSTCDSISSVGKKVHWDFLTDSPQELTLQDNEVVISCGIRFSPSGARLSKTMKVTLDHNAHFTNPRRAEIVFYTRSKDSTTFVRIPASTDGCPRCDVRSKDLDLYVDHFSDWWIVAVITRYFVGKRVNCTPYVRPPVTKGISHLVLLCIYDDLLDVIEKTNKNMKEYIMLYPPQQMFVEWRCGDINIELFDGSKENEEKIGDKILGIRDVNLVEIKQFSFEVKPLESGASLRFLEFTLDQTESPSYPTPIHFNLSYDAAGMSSVANVDFDDILKGIAKALHKNSDINDLGKALGFGPADIGRKIEENTNQGGNYMGTLDLLRMWRNRQTPSTEKAALRSVLLKAQFDNLADQHLSTPVPAN